MSFDGEDRERFPVVPKDLLEALDRLFPDRSPQMSEDYPALRWRGGQRAVIEFLKNQFQRQSADALHGRED